MEKVSAEVSFASLPNGSVANMASFSSKTEKLLGKASPATSEKPGKSLMLSESKRLMAS